MYSPTNDLQSQINKARTVEQLQRLQQLAEEQYATPKVLDYLLQTAEKYGYSKKSFTKLIIQQSTLERSFVYHLLGGEIGLTRDKLIQFSLIGGFSLEEVNTLLKFAQTAQLYARDTRDAVLIYCINNRLSLIATNETLDELGHTILK